MKTLPTLLLTLLVLGGCSTELDRCIEAKANDSDIEEISVEETLRDARLRTFCSNNALALRGEIKKECVTRNEDEFASRVEKIAKKLCHKEGIY